MNKRKIFNTILFVIAAYALYLRVPTILTHFKHQDQKALDFTVKTLTSDNFTLSQQSKKMIMVFWATWCGPCEVELKRINEMIVDKKILPSDVLAIVSQEDEKLIREKVMKEKYLFIVGIDADGTVSRNYEVSVTPTILFIDDKQVINWMTAGISPTLKYRISTFLK